MASCPVFRLTEADMTNYVSEKWNKWLVEKLNSKTLKRKYFTGKWLSVMERVSKGTNDFVYDRKICYKSQLLNKSKGV